METINLVHQDVVLVKDKALAATLSMLGHRAMATFQNEENGKFYCLYKISRRLREDIRHYYAPGHAFNIKSFQDELVAIDLFLAEYRGFIESQFEAKQ